MFHRLSTTYHKCPSQYGGKYFIEAERGATVIFASADPPVPYYGSRAIPGAGEGPTMHVIRRWELEWCLWTYARCSCHMWIEHLRWDVLKGIPERVCGIASIYNCTAYMHHLVPKVTGGARGIETGFSRLETLPVTAILGRRE